MNDHDKSRREKDDKLSAGLSRVYHAADKPEPPAALDAAILAAARSAVDSGALRRAQDTPVSGGLQRWRVPFALAATVVLSVTVTTLVQRERPDAAVFSEAASNASANGSVDSSATQLAAAPVPAATEAMLPPPPLVVARNEAVAPRAAGAAAPKSEAAAQPVPTTDHATTVADEARAVEPALRSEAPMRERKAASPASASVAESVAASATAPFAAAPSAPEQTADAARATTATAESVAEPGAASKAMSVMKAPPPSERRGLVGRISESAQRGVAADETSPERWIEEIRDLKRAGRLSEAATRLQAFRKRFPDYALPTDLKPASTE